MQPKVKSIFFWSVTKFSLHGYVLSGSGSVRKWSFYETKARRQTRNITRLFLQQAHKKESHEFVYQRNEFDDKYMTNLRIVRFRVHCAIDGELCDRDSIVRYRTSAPCQMACKDAIAQPKESMVIPWWLFWHIFVGILSYAWVEIISGSAGHTWKISDEKWSGIGKLY